LDRLDIIPDTTALTKEEYNKLTDEERDEMNRVSDW
jgi:hypothetical protein